MIAPARLAHLPRALARREAQRHVEEVVALATEPVRRIAGYARYLRWDDLDAVLAALRGHPEGEVRGAAVAEQLASVGIYADDETLPPRALAMVTARKFEQDPVRRVMLDALVSWPRRVWHPAHLPAVAQVVRDMLDAADPPTPIPETRQVMAEFAVDLKFGITVNDVVAPNLKVFDMDSDIGGGPIELWTQRPNAPTANNGPGPQRVRTLRFRLATRSAIPDRHGNLLMPAPAPYMVRYCTNPPDCGDPIKSRFARVRTVVSEVSLTNQLGMTY